MAKARKHYDCLKPFWGRKRISDSPPRTGICAGGSTGLGSAPPNWGPSCSTVTNQVTTGGLQSHRSHQGTNHEVQLCHGFPGERDPGKTPPGSEGPQAILSPGTPVQGEMEPRVPCPARFPSRGTEGPRASPSSRPPSWSTRDVPPLPPCPSRSIHRPRDPPCPSGVTHGPHASPPSGHLPRAL